MSSKLMTSRIRTLFLRCVSLCFCVAFHSLYTQVPGLYGDHGVTPARTVISDKALRSASAWSMVSQSPTLLWYYPATGLSLQECMELFCILGAMIGLVTTVLPQYITKWSMLTMWVLYISLYTVGQTFLHFQWDILLLETGALAIMMSPLWCHQQEESLAQDPVTMTMVRWLLFRMMFASGAVKLTSGCDAWWGLTAMPTHYSSQCLPTPLAWWATTLLPDWMHKLSVVSTFIIEIPLTFLFFAPFSALRKLTFFNQIFLMVVIMLTGNYNFFNFLFMALCLSLAEDSWVTRLGDKQQSRSHPVVSCVRCCVQLAVCIAMGWFIGQCVQCELRSDWTLDSRLTFSRQQFDRFLSYAVPAGAGCGALSLLWSVVTALRAAGTRVRGLGTVLLYSSLAMTLFTLSLPSYTGQLDRQSYDRIPSSVKYWDRQLGHLELHHGYGLFRRMTGVGGRPEVIIEGAASVNGPWVEYDFLYKPGNISSAPKFLLPHQPRLDWQMWFAALGSYQHNPWLLSLVYRLLEGRREVLDLLDPGSPFAGTQPASFVRARLYKYHWSQDGVSWWRREELGEYLPPLSLDNSQLVDILTSQGVLGHRNQTNSNTVLAFIRHLSKLAPPHIQIWSYAWIALPLFMPFIKL